MTSRGHRVATVGDAQLDGAGLAARSDVLALDGVPGEPGDQVDTTRQVVVDLDAEIASREAEVAAAQRNVDAAVSATEAGDEVDPQEIPRRRAIVEHAGAVLRGLRRRRERAVDDARLARLRHLRHEIETSLPDDDAHLSALVAAAAEAQAAVVRAARARDVRLRAWTARLNAERVGPAGMFPEPPEANGGLGYDGGGGIAAGRLRVHAFTGDVDLLAGKVATGVRQLLDGYPLDPVVLHERSPDEPAGARYYVADHGGLFRFGPQGPPRTVAQSGNLREVSYPQAVAASDAAAARQAS